MASEQELRYAIWAVQHDLPAERAAALWGQRFGHVDIADWRDIYNQAFMAVNQRDVLQGAPGTRNVGDLGLAGVPFAGGGLANFDVAFTPLGPRYQANDLRQVRVVVTVDTTVDELRRQISSQIENYIANLSQRETPAVLGYSNAYIAAAYFF